MSNPREPVWSRPAPRLAIGATALLVLVIAAYWPALGGGFVWDDRLLVDKNPLVTGKLNLLTLWFQTDFPLTLTTLWLQWLAWGKSSVGYHVVNVLLHALGAVLAWRVLLRLKIPGAWLGAALFAVHPLCAASAAWISEQKNTLSLVFYLASVLFYLDSDSEPEVSSRKSKVEEALAQPTTVSESGTLDFRLQTLDFRYWCSLGLFLLALFSKTSTVMLAPTLLLVAWWRRGRITRRDLLRTAPFFAFALAFGALTIWFQKHQAMAGVAVQSEGFAGRLAGAAWVFWFYLGKALFPQGLNMIYPRWTVNAASPTAWLPLVLLLVVFGVCVAFRRRWGRPVLFALGFFILNLFPVMGFFDMFYLALSRVSDHLVYLPLLGITAGVGAACSWLGNVVSRTPDLSRRSQTETEHAARSTILAGALIMVPLCIITCQRAHILADDERLWRDTLAKNPAAWTGHNNLGCLLAERQKFTEAAKEFEDSLAINPRNAQAHANLARALALQGKMPEAEAHLRKAMEIKPDDADIQAAVGSMLMGQGKLAEALPHMRESVRLGPTVETRVQLAGLLMQAGDAREALSQYRQTLALDPDQLEALNNLAWLLATSSDASLRNGQEAVRAAERACRLTKNQSAIHLGTLAAAFAEAGRYQEAVRAAELSMQVANAQGQKQIVAMNQQFLNFYRAGKPWHQPPGGKPQNPTVTPQ